MTENKRFDSYFDDYMRLWTVSDNENDNMLYPCTSENMANEFCKLLNELNDENQELHIQNDFLKDENQHMRTVINENMQLKKLLRKISNCNGEIWLSNGRIIRLKKIFKGEWIKND